MGWEHIVAFNLTLMAAYLSPGPAMLYFMRQTLSQGRRAGLFAVLGLGVMAAGWTLMALLGLEAVFALFPWAYTVLRIGGALYLIYIAYQTWRLARQPMAEAPPSAQRAFLGGVLINLANPKAVLFAAAVLVVIFPQGLSPVEQGLIVLNHVLAEAVMGTALALLLSTRKVSDGYLRAKPVLDRIAAGVMGLLGLRLLMNR